MLRHLLNYCYMSTYRLARSLYVMSTLWVIEIIIVMYGLRVYYAPGMLTITSCNVFVMSTLHASNITSLLCLCYSHFTNQLWRSYIYLTGNYVNIIIQKYTMIFYLTFILCTRLVCYNFNLLSIMLYYFYVYIMST